jgi:hypothetical protein
MSRSGKDHPTYAIVNDGGAVESLGESDGFGYYALVEDEDGKWYICIEDAMGFWHVRPMADEADARASWGIIDAMHDAWRDAEEEEDRAVKYHERIAEGP